MSRKTIQKNLSYDSERRVYYAVLRREGRRYTRTFRSREAALAALRGQGAAEGVPAGDCTLGQWLRWWLEEVMARKTAESTLYAYRNIVRCHIAPALGDVPLRSLAPMEIQRYLYGRQDGGLSPNTVVKHYVLLTTALSCAVQMELLERSPMDRVTAPRRRETRYTFYSPAQMQRLFTAVAGTMLELPVKLAAYLGLRRSEICGLRWEHVDLEKGGILVREARTEVGGQVVLKTPKTRTSVRSLGIAGLRDLGQLLADIRAARPLAAPGDWVVLREDGQAPKPDQLTRDLLTVVRREGLPHITLHGLRHSFASVANSLGVPMYDISRTLGHSSMTVTSNIYTHLFDETETRTLTLVAQAIEGETAAVRQGAEDLAPR